MAESANLIPTSIKEKTPDAVRFVEGVLSKAKLIGIEDVKEETGDEVCNTSMVKLKAVVLAKKEHKPPIFLKISLDGVHILDQKTNEVLHKHPVDRISYISRDPTDPRAFGYIYKNDKEVLQYIAIKTEKQASEVVLTLKDLFEVVFELRKLKKEEEAKNVPIVPIEPPTPVAPPAAAAPAEPAAQVTANIFDLDENPLNLTNVVVSPPNPPAAAAPAPVAVPPPVAAAPVPVAAVPAPAVDLLPPITFQTQPSTSPPLVPVNASKPSEDVLGLFDNIGSAPASNQANPVKANNEIFTLSPTPDQLKGPDKFAVFNTVPMVPPSSFNPSNQFPAQSPMGSQPQPFPGVFSPPQAAFSPGANIFASPPGQFSQPSQFSPPVRSNLPPPMSAAPPQFGNPIFPGFQPPPFGQMPPQQPPQQQAPLLPQTSQQPPFGW